MQLDTIRFFLGAVWEYPPSRRPHSFRVDRRFLGAGDRINHISMKIPIARALDDLRGGMNDLCCKARSPVVAKRRVIARKRSEGGGESRSRTSRPEICGKLCKRLGGMEMALGGSSQGSTKLALRHSGRGPSLSCAVLGERWGQFSKKISAPTNPASSGPV